jgi:phosphocarrier protein HPr
MVEKEVEVKKALDTRLAAFFVQTASKYKSTIKIELENKKVNAKSLMCLISLGISEGSTIKLCAEGEDAQSAVEEVAAVLA